MYIGIIGAMEIETKKILKNMENVEEIKIGPFKYYTGKLFNKDLVLCTSLEGKVNSAICTQIMILNFNVDKIINVGVAGGLSQKLDIGGIAIANATVEFDQDATALGYKLGYTFGLEEVVIKCDSFANDIYEIAKKNNNTVCGVIASSDKFIVDENIKKMLVKEFNPVAVDMESASINHVCKLNDVDFCALRGISDSGSDEEYAKFVEYATEKINEVLFEYIKSC